MKRSEVVPTFVEFVPDALEEGRLYISEAYRTAVHLCCCGCGEEVVTPLSPADWQIKRNGRGISLYPSVGNWFFPCRSHYWIKDNRVEWAPPMSDKQIADVRKRDQLDKARYVARVNASKELLSPDAEVPKGPRSTDEDLPAKLWRALKSWVGM